MPVPPLLKRFANAGLPPGTPVFHGTRPTYAVRMTVIDFDENDLRELDVTTPEEAFAFGDAKTVTWINVSGVHEVEVIEKMGDHFGVHPLVQEDIAHTSQRPKLEDYEDYLYMVVHMITWPEDAARPVAEQVSLILLRNCVITFQEREGDVFEPIRERIRQHKGRVRRMGADYLFYTLLDAIVDSYFAVLSRTSDLVEAAEFDVMDVPTSRTLRAIQELKRDVLFLRRSVWPLRDATGSLERTESPLVVKSTRAFLRDLYDHTVQLIDTVETLRDVVSGLFDIYLSSVSNRMNEVMKVLTIIATIFIPITFVAGVYGMNFERMPELKWPYGYPAVLAVMAVMTLGMIVYFRKKEWL